MTDVINAAVWPDGTSYQMSPAQFNAQAGDWTDVLSLGLAGAAVNAAYNLSNTVGNPPQTIGISVGTHGNFMPLLILGGLAWVLFSKKG
ncbi:hypothetical protein G5B88_11970 [Herbaspirillum seropedicae]|uniref:hypothetical protein n=1 Tax=Herbaspirillum seropedicae TaxID=964 RepID=UPI0002F63BB9|nr:hypothetical protein [Herbaspirillum seropedicae]AKN65858.1 hypothetical protein ACP92_11815 [Herbaspirillum seropedicae]NQE29010.1 hypothetical protein [Herbaspirillum seropedicae]UMU21835.1 hypothetical protein G5B88_11970 [Herbaspirillum seropedicae]